jgi:CRISPR system Cascade subunit CasA
MESCAVITLSQFSLLDEPWIPALYIDGRTRQVSLRQILAESDRIRSITGDLPTQSFALLRLVLAVLHRAVGGPPSERNWRTLWHSRALPLIDIDSYLDAHRDRFNLTHPTAPFYQVATLRTAKGEVNGLERLIADVPNGTPYLTSRTGTALTCLTYAEAARWVVHCQAYDVSGIKSGAAGDGRVKGGRGYPIGTGSAGGLGGVFMEGRNFRETLLLNLVPLDSPYLDQDPDRDKPVWERPPTGPAEEPDSERGPYGVLSLYTWQSRRIRLFGDDRGITGVLIANGDRLTWENRHRLEPMTAWRRSTNKEKGLKLPQVYVPQQHDPSRALWRGLDALLPAAPLRGGSEGPARLVPVLSQNLARLRNAGEVDADFRVTMRAVGVLYGTQRSVVDEVYHDALTMSVQAFNDVDGLRSVIIDSASDADTAVGTLRTLAANLCRAAGGSGKDAKDPPAAAGTRAAENGYAELDNAFRAWLAGLGPDADATKARMQWQQTAYAIVNRLGNDLVRQASPAAWAGRSLEGDRYISSPQADLWFRRALRRALPLAAGPGPIPETEPRKVPA